ncbi:DUF3237 family protein [Rhizobium sp. RU36D]|uniref:DUF3237 family protein n=1 Tax=Rhizobium sp. RU36D TaxID=1907415 RepID=UPI0009D83AD1|nr:DUF3237 family protein [Rhizobium sp. RU36D]SMC80145.1 Protein of unknown function [Rhizobium sp. RU36D]
MKRESLTFDMMSLGAGRTLPAPVLRKACVIRADIGQAMEFMTTEGRSRAYFPIIGGEVLGGGWSGRIVPGGADFAIALPDGSYAIEANTCWNLTTGHRSW